MRLATLACGVTLIAGWACPARATIDMTGTWTFSGSVLFGSGTYWVQQAGTLVTLCSPQASGNLHGTIDPETGALTWDFSPYQNQPIPVPGGYACEFQWTGTVSPDGNSLTANERYGTFCVPPPFTCNGQCTGVSDHPASGTRVSTSVGSCNCGNGIVDPGEVCDPGAGTSCCSSDCSTAAPAGTGCQDDGNPCTDDVCDGTGACTHPANTAPCGSTCQSGVCEGGTCQLGSPAPAGTSCNADNNRCTVDTCDGTGHCVADYVCGPCTTCNPAAGCVALAVTSCHQMDHGGLDIRLGTTPDRDTVRGHFVTPYGPTEPAFGDPTTTTSYTFCVLNSSSPGVTNILLDATAPAASTCGANPCWSGGATAVRYHDPAGTSDGVRSIRGNGAPGAKRRWSISGRGAALPLPSVLPAGDTISAALVAHDGPTFQNCWGGTFTSPTTNSTTRYHAKK